MNYIKRNEIIDNDNLVLATLPVRFFSLLLDVVFIIFIYVFLEILLQLLGFDLQSIDVANFTHVEFVSKNIGSTGMFIIKCLLISIPTLYFTLTVFFLNGQTIGKRIFKLRVVSLYHKKIGFWHCLERSLGYAASTLEFGLGFVQAIWNHNRMSLHDKIAETIVIKIEKKKELN